MQLVLSNNRIIAHGENFLSMGGVVINTETGAKYENATIAECEGCPSDIDKVGYEYHAGVFVPCAPFGTGNNNGYFMEVCESCATPRSSGIPILGGLERKNLNMSDFYPLLWENASPSSAFYSQTITLSSATWDFLICETSYGVAILSPKSKKISLSYVVGSGTTGFAQREVTIATNKKTVQFGNCQCWKISSSKVEHSSSTEDALKVIPQKIYGVRI